jgi:hypothetical protein
MYYLGGTMFSLYKVIEYCKSVLNERRDRVVSTPASYLGGPELKSRPRDRLS